MADTTSIFTAVATSLLSIDKIIYVVRNRNGNSNESKIRRVVQEETATLKEDVKEIKTKVENLRLEMVEVQVKQDLAAGQAAGI